MGAWSALEAGWPIHVQELAAVVISVTCLRPLLPGRNLLVRCDNAAVVAAMQRGVASDERLNCLLRLLHRLTGQLSLRLSAVHVPGVHNAGADALSRNDLTRFALHIPPLSPLQKPAPAELRSNWWREWPALCARA
jgi:hypothetical protein